MTQISRLTFVVAAALVLSGCEPKNGALSVWFGADVVIWGDDWIIHRYPTTPLVVEPAPAD